MKSRTLFTLFLVVCGFSSPSRLTSALAIESPAAGDVAFFEQKIRPVLVKHCYQCHAQTSKPLRGGLLLDSKAGWQTGGDSGPAVVPGKPDESLLLSALKHRDLMMPPKRRLPEAIINDFAEWIRRGAPDPRTGAGLAKKKPIDVVAGRQFWAFQPVQRPSLPQVGNPAWPQTAIDFFILRRLEEAGLQPNQQAPPAMLVRRLYFDLTGLPPTPQQVQAFVAKPTDQSYERLVDQLLASPRFGEKWGRHWLDVARYADSNGGDINLTFYNAWRFRDYVIGAFNSDMPYAQFLREQIAGDLMTGDEPTSRTRQLIATGFLLVGPKMLSERDKEKLYLDVADEQIDSIGRAFLGLTLGCARCHDHKFDPIPMQDYYALAGIFRSTQTVHGIRMGNVNVSGWLERTLPIEPEHRQALDAHERLSKALDGQLKDAKKKLAAAQKAAKTLSARSLGIIVDDVDAKQVGEWKKSTVSPNYIGQGYVHDDKTGKGRKSITFVPQLPTAGEYEVRIAYAANNGRARNVPVTIRHAAGETTIRVDQQPTPPIENLLRSLGRFRLSKGNANWVRISTEGTEGKHVIADAVQFIPVEQLQAIAKPETAEVRALRKKVTVASATVQRLEKRIKELKKQAPPPAPATMAVRDHDKPANSPIHVRGEVRQLGPLVPRGYISVLQYQGQAGVATEQSGRLQLANWLADVRNPLTARVMVNRIWHHMFGQGLVPTVDNFGARGQTPSHPQLLDYLATRFMVNDWSVKQLIREIALSRAYQLSTTALPDPLVSSGSANRRAGTVLPNPLVADPENRLLWRQRRRRLTAEALRDAVLAVSGQLDLTAGGSSVAKLPESAIANSAKQAGGLGYEKWQRRAIYMPIVRNDLPHALQAFDFANPDVVAGARPITTVPAQALWLMNSNFVRDAADRIAEQILPLGDNRSRAKALFQQLLSRQPTAAEIADVISYVQSNPAPLKENWAEVCQAILASTQFRFLE